jgi:uncharacterized membrane protein SirB2
MDYTAVKLVHESAVAISAAGFFARGCGMLTSANWIRHRVARTLPHVVDTVLLLSAIALAAMLRITPTSAPWLGAKIAGLVAYVVLGVIAFRGRNRTVKATAWLAALLVFAYIVSVAITKSPLGFLAAS